MVIECGHNFCKHCIEEWQKKFIEENPYEEQYPCPECRAVFKTLSPNISLKNFINDLSAVILDKEQRKEREETIKECLEKKNNPPIPSAEANDQLSLGPIINIDYNNVITLERLQQIANNFSNPHLNLHQQSLTEDGLHSDSIVDLNAHDMELDRNSELRVAISSEINERLPNLPWGAGTNDVIGNEVITDNGNAENYRVINVGSDTFGNPIFQKGLQN